MIYLTVNDGPSGVYKSQVIDVVQYLNRLNGNQIKLVAFVSLRNYFSDRKVFKNWYENTVVIPMLPGIKRWKKNWLTLFFVRGIRSEVIIARNVMAASIAMMWSKKVIYDGRGAVGAELMEYPDIISNKKVVAEIFLAEKHVVLNSAFRISVSNKLITYWRQTFGYSLDDHIIIPCTLSLDFSSARDPDTATRLKEELGFNLNDIILVYSGGTSGWQSFPELMKKLEKWIVTKNISVLFLTSPSPEILNLRQKFPSRVKQKWVEHKQVQNYLSIGDYGILIRDQNITNSVASPVKFAEYLSAGLQILISPSLGDYTRYVDEYDLGVIVREDDLDFYKTTDQQRQYLSSFASTHFSKLAQTAEFERLLKI